MDYIHKKKDEFKQKQIERQTEQLRQQKVREGNLAKVNAKLIKERRDVDAIKKFNEKADASRPNHIKNLINKLKENSNQVQKEGKISSKKAKRFNSSVNGSVFSMGNSSNNPFSGNSKPLNVGMTHSPFNQPLKKELQKKKKSYLIIKV
jgi:hypothetical protein